MNRFTITVFGGFHMSVDGCELPSPPSRRAADLLTYLLLTAPIAHQRQTLAAMFWPDLPEDRAMAALRQVLFRMQGWLEEIPGGAELLDTRRQTIACRLSDVVVDVLNLERVWQVVRRHAHRSIEGCADCLTQLSSALSLFGEVRGQSAGSEEPYHDWLQLRMAAVTPLLTDALALLCEQQLRGGAYGTAQQLARKWLAIDPWHEAAHRALILALALDGRRTEAMAHTRSFQRRLIQEFGFDVDPETLRLSDRIAGESPAQLQPRVFRIPAADHLLIGRERELAAMNALINDSTTRLISLIGIGGVGKTVLAAEAARRAGATFRDGAVLVSLIGRQTLMNAAQAVADALQLTFRDRRDVTEQLAEKLAPLEVLLLLDNAEQVEGLSELINGLLRDCPRVLLLVTSREPLGHLRERVVIVRGLVHQSAEPSPDPSPAAQLMLHLITRAMPVREDGDQQAVIERICRQLDGHPLAMTLIAHQARFTPLADIEAQISRHLQLAESTIVGLPLRHRQIGALIDDALTGAGPEVTALLQDLCWFETGFSRVAACTVAAVAIECWMPLINRAAAFGLVQLDAGGFSTMHPLIRSELRRRMVPEGTMPAGLLRFVDYHLGLLLDSGIRYVNASSVRWTEQHSSELDDIFRASALTVHAGRLELLYHAIPALLCVTVIRGLQQHTLQLFEQITRKLSGAITTLERSCLVRLHTAHAWLCVTIFAIDDTLASVQAALAVPDAPALRTDRLWARRTRASALIVIGRLQEAAADLVDEDLPADEEIAPVALARPLASQGRLAVYRAQLREAQQILQQALQQRRELGDTRGELACLIDLAQVITRLGDRQTALRVLIDAVAVSRSMHDDTTVSAALANLGALRAESGLEPEQAEHELLEALDLARRTGNRFMMRTALYSLVPLMIARSRIDAAIRFGRDYLQIELAYGVRRIGLTVAVRVAEVLISRGSYTDAHALLQFVRAHAVADDALRAEVAALLAGLPQPFAGLTDGTGVLSLQELLARL